MSDDITNTLTPSMRRQWTAERIRRYAQEKGLSLFGGGLLREAQCVREDGRLVATAIIWAPLHQDERVFGSML